MSELSPSDVFLGDSNLAKLVEELDELFPPYTASPANTIEEIMYRSGHRSIVEYIKDKLAN